MSASKKQKTTRKRPPAGRPLATTTISQPTVEDAAKQTIKCSFAPDGDLFAFLMLAVDKHRLRVYDTHTNQSVAEYTFESARATSLKWAKIDLSTSEDADSQPFTKKRRMKDASATEEFVGNDLTRIVILGTSDGAILLFSPSHGRVVRKLSHPSSNAAILSVAIGAQTIWACGADSAVRVWDIQSGNIHGHWKNEECIPYTCMSLLPAAFDTEEQQILVAHHSIQLFSSSARYSRKSEPEKIASFTGHASQVKNLEWDTSQSPSERFYSSAEGDRFVYMWQISREGSIEGKTLLSIPLESAVDTFMQLQLESGIGGLTLVTLSMSGKVAFFYISDDISTVSTPASSDNRLGQKVPTLVPQSQISQTGEPTAKIVGISPIPGQQGYIRVSRLINGIRPIFDDVRYIDDAGNFVQNVVLEDVNNIISNELIQQTTYSKRYAEGANVAVKSGVELGLVERLEDGTFVDGELNVDLAELSLGQRLTATAGEDKMLSGSDKNDSDSGRKSKESQEKTKGDVVPANSLTRTLIQALHSSDSGLLETCLAHSDPALISNTVKRLPVQFAVPLITACTDRLGRGARSANLKGRGGGASSQRGSTLVIWIRTVLVTHGGYLMTIPDLVAKLSGLHATLTTRLTLQQSLLSLSGRLELVLSQMQLRSSVAPAPLVSKSEKTLKSKAKEATKYVEGESEDEGKDEQMDIEGIDDDDGSIEDVELGASSEDANSEELDEANDSEDEDDMVAPTLNGFVDDEAEEYSEEDDSDSE